MKIELDNATGETFHIDSYKTGSILVGGQPYTSSFIITPSLIEKWPPKKFSDITVHCIKQILILKPEFILLGTGRHIHFPDNTILAPSIDKNIGIEIMDTGAACRCYNILLQEGRNVAAALLMIE